MRTFLIILTCFLIPIMLFSQEKRVALVIGNSNYQIGAPLSNPVNDAEDIGAKLQEAGFDISVYKNLTQSEMKKNIDSFGEKLNNVDIALFFYAGHGVQAKGKNYLIPVDADLKTENDVEYNCVDAGRILAKMEDANTKTNIVILDACRNNPFERSWSRSTNGNGLAFINAPSGSLIAYSTAPGKTASDGYHRNSPYTESLLKFIDTPNLKIEDFFKLVRVKVIDKTKGQQEPWESTSLRGDFFFNADQEESQSTLNDILSKISTDDESVTGIDNNADFETKRQQLASEIKSIAILPFSNYSGDKNIGYMASGLQDALISELGQLGTIRVISSTSTKQYANMQKTISEVAGELDVDGIVEASLISLGKNIRMQLKLYCANPVEQMLWSKEYDSDISDILTLYNNVIKNIAEEIQLSLSPEIKSKLNRDRQRIDPEAYKAYLRGYHYWEKVMPDSIHLAIENFELAIEKEPAWADPYVGLAQSWNLFGIFKMIPYEAAVRNKKRYLKKAYELDPESEHVHYGLALDAVWTDANWEPGEKEFLKTLEINPNNALARLYYAHLLLILHRPDEAILQANIGLNLDPARQLSLGLYAVTMRATNNYQLALSTQKKAEEIAPGFGVGIDISSTLYLAGEYDAWIERFARKVIGYLLMNNYQTYM